jgi:hypothetical protein
MCQGIGDEFLGIDLGDRRLNRRGRALLEALAADPAASINAACHGWAETQAAYRFFANGRVTPEAVLRPHAEATRRRIAQQAEVLILQDTTELDFTRHPARDAGVLNRPDRFGLYDHTHLAVTADRLPLGVLRVDLFDRTPAGLGRAAERHADPIEAKESFRWLEGYRLACGLTADYPATRVVSVADCEGDIYEVFLEARRHATPADFVIRARLDRATPEPDPAAGPWAYRKVRREVAEAPVLATRRLDLPATPRRAARAATVEVRARAVRVKPPHARPALGEVSYRAVLAQEVGGPGDGTDVCWLLLTSLPIDSAEEALRVVDAYAARWAIEVYFRVYKAGCRVEEIRLETSRRLGNALMLYKVIAWRVMYLTILGRACPELPCDVLFTAAEWQSVWRIARDEPVPATAPPLAEFLGLLGQLGGYNRRPGEGPPGPQALWVGIRRMTDFALAWQRFGPAHPP